MRFFLGTHKPAWLRRTDVPLFVSRRTLCNYVGTPKAIGPWALDSGGFSELSMFGRWETDPWTYINEVQRWQEEAGGLQWAAIQDWMCEPFILNKTGFSVRQHQALTLDSWHRLSAYAPHIPWAPVLQGWRVDDYLHHAAMYRESGVKLEALPIVGVGSICRRQATDEALEILRALHGLGIKLHGFGLKIDGLWNGASALLESADSMAWSRAARYEPPLPDCTHKTCANCMRFALRWRESVLAAIRRGQREFQPTFAYS